MERRLSFRGKAILLGMGLSIALAFSAWTGRAALLRWYYLRGLARAGEADRQLWVQRVEGLDASALPGLIDCLGRSEPLVCANAQAALKRLVAVWDKSDSRCSDLSEKLAAASPRLSTQGQLVALDLQGVLLHDAQTEPSRQAFLAGSARTLAASARTPDKNVRHQALLLVTGILERDQDPETLGVCMEVTRACLDDEAPENRIQAIQLALQYGMKLLDSVVALLHDPVPEVRRFAMLAVGPSPNAINTDDLLPWLHDADSEVRHLCEEALRSRGLQERHLQLGRLMTDSSPGTRLQVLDLIKHASDLEPGVWLRRLSHDPAPAVRAAAARAAGEESSVNLEDRLEQMAQNDPCPTVRQLAHYYLSTQRGRSRGELP